LDLLATTEATQKFGHLVNLRAAVQRAKEAGIWDSVKKHYKYTPYQASELQHRQQELREFLATMPLRAVT
jgi:hypothetical protein